jgi:hypothetical protein
MRLSMTTNLHDMFGLPNKKADHKARLVAATEHMRAEVKDVFRELGLQEGDPCQRRLIDACNAWVQAATEMADAHVDHMERHAARINDRAIIRTRREVAITETERWRDINRALLPQRVLLVLAVALVAAMTGFVAGQYYCEYTAASALRSAWTIPPPPPQLLPPPKP